MGLNVGGIYVRCAPAVTQLAVLETVRDYWLKIGAAVSALDPLSIESLSLEKSGRLAYLVAPKARAETGEEEWIAVYDSERYRSDPALARHLALHFATDVWLYEVTDTVNRAYAKLYGKNERVLKKPERVAELIAPMPYPFLYFNLVRDDLDQHAISELLLIAFEGIPYRPKAKYSGPSAARLASNDKLRLAQELVKKRASEALLTIATCSTT
jgi:hypothetical protein